MSVMQRKEKAHVRYRKLRKHILLFCIPLLLMGCAGTSKYACPGMPDGVVCKSPVEVYQMTEGADHVTGGSKENEEAAVLPKQLKLTGNLLVSPEGPKPVLQPASVARIWIAPWIDASNDLHWPGYVFTEITPRRWAIGEAPMNRSQPLVPLQIRQRNSVDTITKGGQKQ